MSDPFVSDDVLEAVLRSRAGDGVPSDLHAQILAAVAADGPRVVARRRSVTGRPWRLLAVAALLLGTISTAVIVGAPGHADDPEPSQPAVVANVSPSPSPSPDVDVHKSGFATPSPRPSPQTVHSVQFEVPLSFTENGLWVYQQDDTPREFRIAFSPDSVGDGNPVVTIGLPYGYASAAEYVQKIKTLRYPSAAGGTPVKDFCSGMEAPKRATLVGLSGFTFDCWTEANIDFIPIYPKDRRGATAGVPASLDASGDWFVIPKGGPYLRFFVADVRGTTIIVSIAGAGGGGAPRQPAGLTLDTVARFDSLDLRFGS